MASFMGESWLLPVVSELVERVVLIEVVLIEEGES
jgi:hypothetical protein